MTIRRLKRPEWSPFFDVVPKLLEATGDQTQAEWLPLLGITYEPRDNIVEIALDGVDHMISKPRGIYLDNGLMHCRASRL